MSIDEINIDKLQSISIADRAALPKIEALYFVISAANVVEYVGQTDNLCRRWRGHECLSKLSDPTLSKIAWVEVADAETRLSLEKELVDTLRPALNWVRETSDPKFSFNECPIDLPDGFLSAKEISSKTGIALSTVNMYCRKKIFPNAIKFPTIFGALWMIPETDLPLVKKRGRGKPKSNPPSN